MQFATQSPSTVSFLLHKQVCGSAAIIKEAEGEWASFSINAAVLNEKGQEVSLICLALFASSVPLQAGRWQETTAWYVIA